jgi:single-stranded DNA-binding protein
MRTLFVGRIVKRGDLRSVGQRNTSLLAFHVTDLSDRNNKEWECQLWGRQAENASLTIGDVVFIDGSLEEREYEDKNRQRHVGQRINVSEITRCNAADKPVEPQQPKPEPSKAATPQAAFDFGQEEADGPKDDLYRKAEQEKKASDPEDELPF